MEEIKHKILNPETEQLWIIMFLFLKEQDNIMFGSMSVYIPICFNAQMWLHDVWMFDFEMGQIQAWLVFNRRL